MDDKMRYILKLLIIVLLNICVIGIVGRSASLSRGGGSVPAILSSGSRADTETSGFDSDYELLARLIYAESQGEPYNGQVAVGAVILNRVQHPSFPDSIAGVAYQPGAFAATTNGRLDAQAEQSAYRAAREALNGVDPSGGAVYYYNLKKSPNEWILSRPVIKIIGNHRFCR